MSSVPRPITTPSPTRPPAEAHSSAHPAGQREYLEDLTVPSKENLRRIDSTQRRKEVEVDRKYGHEEAAKIIQRNYRGFRVRRELQGLSLNPSSRWAEAIQDARYRAEITPRQRGANPPARSPGSPAARARWRHFSKIAQHAHGSSTDPDLEPAGAADAVDPVEGVHSLNQDSITRAPWRGKVMGLPYFLEMVDQKHRYGSNLRQYHAEWLKADTHENFFYWLDHGEGQSVELERVSRHRLEKEQVRYLSREERLRYLVVVDQEGKLCWNKNGQRIDTTAEWRDSVVGIVPLDDKAKTFRQDEIEALEAKARASGQSGTAKADRATSSSSSSSSSSDAQSDGSSSAGEAERRYPDADDFQDAKGVKKVAHVSVDTIMNRLMRKSVKKKTWIFVADTRMNLYVGMKQSGSFQHSSFMRGSRISSAGQIKIKRGQLRSLSPLSGHYQPPLAAFRHFVAHLHQAGVDMSRVSISKSYAVLLGLEAYIGGKTQVKKAERSFKEGLERVIHPTEAKARREAAKDSSQSARLEEEHRRRRQQEQATLSWRGKMTSGLTSRPGTAKGDPFPQSNSRPSARTSEDGRRAGMVSQGSMASSHAADEAVDGLGGGKDPHPSAQGGNGTDGLKRPDEAEDGRDELSQSKVPTHEGLRP